MPIPAFQECELRRIMTLLDRYTDILHHGGVIFAFLALRVLGYPSNIPWDLDDPILVPSLTSEDDTSSADLWKLDDSIFTPDSLQDYSPVSQTLHNADDGLTQPPFGELFFADSDFFVGHFKSLVATTNYGSEDSASSLISNCDSSSLDYGDFLADYSPTDSSFNILDPSISVANTDDNLSMFNRRSRVEPRSPGGAAGSYEPKPRYELDPATNPETQKSSAYAADGTPISPMNCPSGKKKACCAWDAIPPFSQCWIGQRFLASVACRPAKNQACCAEVPEPGGPGIDCEPVQWGKSRDGRTQRDPNQSQGGPSSTPFQDTFPILQPLPDLTPSPNLFCSPSRQRRT